MPGAEGPDRALITTGRAQQERRLDVAPGGRFELPTKRLTGARSATELPRMVTASTISSPGDRPLSRKSFRGTPPNPRGSSVRQSVAEAAAASWAALRVIQSA